MRSWIDGGNSIACICWRWETICQWSANGSVTGTDTKQHSSGGKDRLLGISKRGDAYLRSLLIHGARSAIYAARGKEDRLSQWVMSIATRRHPNIAAVALANKTTRIAWAMLRHDTEYDPELAAA